MGLPFGRLGLWSIGRITPSQIGVNRTSHQFGDTRSPLATTASITIIWAASCQYWQAHLSSKNSQLACSLSQNLPIVSSSSRLLNWCLDLFRLKQLVEQDEAIFQKIEW